jgi:peptidoglycan/xylan/chitin deacetylase (PgdA/CDA1 family)
VNRLAVLVAAGVWCGPGLATHSPALCRALGIDRRVPGDGVLLTFDDGPHPEGTPAVLSALGATRAVFFMVGEQVERYPSLAAEVTAAGHEVALHGYRHRNQMRVTPRWLAEDLKRGAAAIEDATGRRPTLYRPPYGIFTPAGLWLSRHYERLLWSKWGRDWRARTTPDEIARLATRDLTAGDVILLHDADWYSAAGSHRRTAAAVPMLLEALYPTGSGSAKSTTDPRSHSM